MNDEVLVDDAPKSPISLYHLSFKDKSRLLTSLKTCITCFQASFGDDKNNNKIYRQFALIFLAIHDYVYLAHESVGQSFFDDANKALFLSSLEQIIVSSLGGLAYGSGLNRKTFELLHADAMLVYYAMYGELPCYLDAKERPTTHRALFREIFARLYHSGLHQEVMAYSRGRGVQGFKNHGSILPSDLLTAINTIAKDNSELNTYDVSEAYASLGNIKKLMNRKNDVDVQDEFKETFGHCFNQISEVSKESNVNAQTFFKDILSRCVLDDVSFTPWFPSKQPSQSLLPTVT